MTRAKLAALGLVAAILMPLQASADTASDEQAILEIWSAYSTARVAGDAETWLDLWDKDSIRMPPGRPAMDFATFAPGTPQRFAKPPTAMEINSEEVVIADDWAYSRGTFVVNNTVEGKFLTIFRRQEDGSWRIYRDAFNMNSD